MRDIEVYLGDGVYASYDGYHVKLRVPRFGAEDMIIYLNFDVIRGLTFFIDTIKGATNEKE